MSPTRDRLVDAVQTLLCDLYTAKRNGDWRLYRLTRKQLETAKDALHEFDRGAFALECELNAGD